MYRLPLLQFQRALVNLWLGAETTVSNVCSTIQAS